jgi:trigger factor
VTNQAPVSQKFQGEHVKATITKNPGCKVHLEVEVDATAVGASYAKALHLVKKEVSIPGFRKGKVPDDVVIKNFASAIDREWRDLTARAAFHDGLALVKCNPLSQNAVQKVVTKKISKEGAEIHFDYESEPVIPTLDFSSI